MILPAGWPRGGRGIQDPCPVSRQGAKNAEIRTITGNLSGNATSATTATNDTKGQAITSYIRALSISGRTITYTKGDGTTGTITTQDTNTTYTILPANPTVYKEEIFKKDFTGFENLDFERFVTTKTADEMNEFLETGDFPNPFERKDGQSEPRVMEETVKQEEQKQPVQDQGFNRLRSSQPIRSTFNTQKQEEQPKQQGIRRYTY